MTNLLTESHDLIVIAFQHQIIFIFGTYQYQSLTFSYKSVVLQRAIAAQIITRAPPIPAPHVIGPYFIIHKSSCLCNILIDSFNIFFTLGETVISAQEQ